MNKTKWLGGLLGLGIVAYLFYSIGWDEISKPLFALGWKVPYVFLPFFLTNYINTWAWVCTFSPPYSKYRLSFVRLFWVRICGEFINNFTPTAHVGGDVTRVWMLKNLGVSSTQGLVTVIMDKAALIISEILFIYTGIFLFLAEVELSATTRILVGASLLIALLVIYLVIAAVHKGLFSKISHVLSAKWHWQAIGRLHDKIKHLDTHLTRFYRNQHREFLWSNYLHYVGWIVGALETWVILYLLGKPVGVLDAIMIEAMITLAKGLGVLIPGSLGVLEGGSVLLFQMLDFGQGLGLTFSLLKRAREFFFGTLGWAVLSVQGFSVKPGESQPTSP